MAMRIERPHCTKTLTPRHRSTRSVGDRLRAARAHAAGPGGASTSAAAAAAIIVPLVVVVVVVVVVTIEAPWLWPCLGWWWRCCCRV